MPQETTSPPKWPGRKREDTRARLVTATFATLAECDFGNITAELVAERAGVSRRTFFNYFPSVESVISATFRDFFDQVNDRLLARPPGEALITSLRAVGLGPAEPEFLTQLSRLSAIAQQSEPARFMLREFTTDWLYWLEKYLKENYLQSCTEEFALHLACAIVASAEATLLSWYRITNGEITDQTVLLYHNMWQQALNYLEQGFGHDLPPRSPERSTD